MAGRSSPIIIQSRPIPPPFSVIGRLVHYSLVDGMEDINLGVAHKDNGRESYSCNALPLYMYSAFVGRARLKNPKTRVRLASNVFRCSSQLRTAQKFLTWRNPFWNTSEKDPSTCELPTQRIKRSCGLKDEILMPNQNER
jgi:hypothetical protein